MHAIARKVLVSYLSEKKIPTLEELSATELPDAKTKHLVFVTIYKDGAIVGSSGRVHAKRENTILELVDNTLACLSDVRMAQALITPADLDKIKIRVDIIRNEDRRILQSYKDIDVKTEGYILLSQNLGKLAVLLPHITNIAGSAEELFDIVCKKAGLEPAKLTSSDYVLYGIKSTSYSEF